MTDKAIVVVGSANVDLIMKMDRLPRVGETVTDAEFLQTFGGKGANQVVAAARSGGEASFVCCVGDDNYGDQVIQNLQNAGVNTDYVTKAIGSATGTALIMINERGENYLSVAPGANYRMLPEHVDKAWRNLENAAMIVLQDEITLETIDYTIERASQSGRQIMFNVAPARHLGNLPLDKVDFLLVNETEAAFLTGLKVNDEVQAWQAVNVLLAKGPRNVLLTMGAQGCLAGGDGLHEKVTAYRVDAVDTTAAGDVFCGALATALVEGKPLLESLQFASAASAIAVTRLGAQPSIPDRAEIEAFMKQHHNR